MSACHRKVLIVSYPPLSLVQAPPCVSTETWSGCRFSGFFLTTVFMVRNLAERDCVLMVEGNRGRVMCVMSPPAHNNIMLGTANHCCLF